MTFRYSFFGLLGFVFLMALPLFASASITSYERFPDGYTVYAGLGNPDVDVDFDISALATAVDEFEEPYNLEPPFYALVVVEDQIGEEFMQFFSACILISSNPFSGQIFTVNVPAGREYESSPMQYWVRVQYWGDSACSESFFSSEEPPGGDSFIVLSEDDPSPPDPPDPPEEVESLIDSLIFGVAILIFLFSFFATGYLFDMLFRRKR